METIHSEEYINNLKNIVFSALEENKAENIAVLDLLGKTDIARYMIIATGRADRHIRALSEHLGKALKEINHDFVIEGKNTKDWVLIDTYDIIIHIFNKESRNVYDLESLWKK